MIWFLIGLLLGLAIGIQIGYWASALHVWGQEMLAYLGAIKKQRKGIPVPRASLIAPDGEPVDITPNIIKPKTPKQIRIEQVAKIRERGL